MSEETFGIMRMMDMEGVETQAALQCAPLLAGLKISNLLHVGASQKEEVFRMFEGSPVSCRLLYQWKNRVALFLYREKSLKRYLSGGKVQALLNSFGYEYEGMDLEPVMEKLSSRYQKYMERKASFPHEIGFLLGYPPEDVTGFIENQGRNFLYSGYWKVYGDPAKARRVFEEYDRAREAVIRMAGNGRGIKDIMAYYHDRKRPGYGSAGYKRRQLTA